MAKKYAYWISSGKYSMLQQLSVVFLGLASFMFLVRVFEEPAKFGVWAIFITISSIVETARAALIKNGYIYFINSLDEKDHRAVEGASLTTNCIFSGILILFFFLSGSWLENIFHAPQLSRVLNYYAIALILLIPFFQKENFFTAKMDFKSIFWMYCVRNGIFMLICMFFFLTKHDVSLPSLTIFYGLCIVAGYAVTFFSSADYEKKNGFVWDPKVFRRFIQYGKYVFGNNVFSLIFRNTDTFMAARYISPVAPAFYSTGTRVTNFADMPSQVLGNIMFPKAMQIVKTGNIPEIKKVYEKTVAATLTFIIPVILFVSFFQTEIILILAGKKYLEAAGILQIMILYALFLPFIRQFGNIMDAMGRPQWNFFLMLIFVLFNIGSNLLFIKQFGMPGAAYGTLFSYFVLFVTTQLILARLINVSLLNIITNVFLLYPDYLKLMRNSFSKFFKLNYEK